MTNGPCSRSCSVWLLYGCFVFAGIPASAISYLGDRASGCFTLNAGGTHVLTLSNGTSAGDTLLVHGMVSGGAAGAPTPVSDTRANTWVLAHSYTSTNGARLFIFESKIAAGKNHSPGDTVTLSFSGGTGQKSCVVLSNWTGIQLPSSVDRMNGASNTSMSPTVSTNGATTMADELLIAGFGFVAATGGFSMPPPMQLLSGACDAPHCYFPGYRILTSTGSYSAAATTSNNVNWGGILVTLKADNTIFSDGFEIGTTANWSFTQT